MSPIRYFWFIGLYLGGFIMLFFINFIYIRLIEKEKILKILNFKNAKNNKTVLNKKFCPSKAFCVKYPPKSLKAFFIGTHFFRKNN